MNRFLGRYPIFKRTGSVAVLFIFILAITPRITLHNWFANHIDRTSGRSSSDKSLISKAGFNCKCDDLVAEGHFVSVTNVVVLHISAAYSFISYTLPGFQCGKVFHYSLRGPPFAIC